MNHTDGETATWARPQKVLCRARAGGSRDPAMPRSRSFRTRTSRSAIVALLAWTTLSAKAPAQNFRSNDVEICRAAESARIRSARFWTGRDLPGRWFEQCPIFVAAASGPKAAGAASGRTTFAFSGGEVSRWSMTVAGGRAAILADVVPHEVDHMVRASLVRHAIPRWLDEGCAGLWESPEAHRQLRERVFRDPQFRITPEFLEGREYPNDPSSVQRIYAAGFSAVEFLLEQGGPDRLLELQCGRGSPVAELRRVYGFSPEQFDVAWRRWWDERAAGGQTCDRFGCAMHSRDDRIAPGGYASAASVLTVYSASWCPACGRFWSDLRSNETFSTTLRSQFQIHRVDVAPGGRAGEDVRVLPTFVAGAARIEGYAGPDWLLARLGPSAPARIPDAPPAANPAVGEAPIVPPVATVPAIPTEKEVAPLPERTRLPAGKVIAAAETVAPFALTILQWAGILGGTMATGGVGGIAVALVLAAIRRRRARPVPMTLGEEVERVKRAPFPRHLDEARELLGLRQSEGRVAALDALRGMFLDDEAAKILQGADGRESGVVSRLLAGIDARVEEVAPLATSAAE